MGYPKNYGVILGLVMTIGLSNSTYPKYLQTCHLMILWSLERTNSLEVKVGLISMLNK